MQDELLFEVQEELIVGHDIKDPDRYIDKLLMDFSEDAEMLYKLETIKSLDHSEKTSWLLNLKTKEDFGPGMKKTPPLVAAAGCVVVVVTTVVLVIVGYKIVNGVRKAIKERQERQKEVLKCTGKKPRRK